MSRGGVLLLAEEGREVFERAGFSVVSATLTGSDPAVIGQLHKLKAQLEAPRFVVGVGAGGLYARLAACAVLGLSGAVSFGGRLWYPGIDADHPIQPFDLLPGLSCPLQCHFAADDADTPQTWVDELEKRLRAAGRPHQVFRYGHLAGADRDTAWGRARNFLLHLSADAR